MRRSVFCGVGAFLPAKVITNDDLSLMVDTTDEWVFRRTGIKRRHVVEEGDTVSCMATEAAKIALEDAGVSATEVDLIIVATATPDKTMPSCATMVQGSLGCKNAAAFDINAACSGFLYALSIVDSMIKAGQANIALIIGSEAMSKVVDWTDRSTCVLFGDGAGAFVFKGQDETEKPGAGVMSTLLCADGSLGNVLYTNGGVASTGKAGYICMKGTVLFEHAVVKLSSAISALLESSALDVDSIDWFIPHQANVRIIDLVINRLGLSRDKVILSIDEHANTSSASIPLAMYEAKRAGRIKKGNLVLFAAIGAGITWGVSLLRL
ncbi:3-oxoacyl-[acyl-carrier-protein] synthase III [Anaplasma marginale str. St. Maries]|uniref:Beta-ketoacyl-[acyl-carrier-protein] synthase III n=1 Tax=Anaplasma marginale (strain St. Maries) TaxID=234826 RepID=FABH_ANAMM|nr:beta-ketoacyl-ACP synthase III [Anaplasma marginale]Q5PA98.1 RecName: Full=Beta-ketoacyl-[acyl-carrier-protein] synthase III; Short=Beta-ketoacyl-ACP synthase III; Short=KAS III; AltName: Full=3-oxoacyl-[acyl-carrier-protein] synthase 3; AltName: Full=3-oxoacyl-[acyl-carrier-protein] synthase III [Anaplasma marginale str. St. Maries]AAV86782.1 3-oxoacyl-[acyl-carrier-protein] synthase III [Anaplasma marginale str. St. Maries]